jgi:HD-GYP domain-containing protein (c-di-GMP phosphodiesterase class II)
MKKSGAFARNSHRTIKMNKANDDFHAAASALIYNLSIAMTSCSLYSIEHPIINQITKKSLSLIHRLLEGGHTLDIMILGDDVVIQKHPLSEKGLHIANFIKKMSRKEIEMISIQEGITEEELISFISEVCRLDEAFKDRFKHIATGKVEVRLKPAQYDDQIMLDSSEDENLPKEKRSLSQEEVERLKDAYDNASRFQKLNVVGLEDMVINFMAVYRKEANILNLLPQVKTYSEYTYTHATNVAILSMFQAESLGFEGNILHDIGISALLHDVGKTFIASDILNKKEQLTPEEWEEMKKHAIYGARYLASVKEVPRLSIIAALEHHLKYNGTGYPHSLSLRRKQHICSQIISISDFFDALRTDRPYRKCIDTMNVVMLLKEGAGKEFNPLLVNNFIKIMKNHVFQHTKVHA